LEADAVDFPALQSNSLGLIELSRSLGNPIVWPVGAAAERIVGAAMLKSTGDLRARAWNREVRGERVLVFATVALTPLTLVAAARQALCMGAIAVEACGIHVEALQEIDLSPVTRLHQVPQGLSDGPRRLRATG
jgi:hypothetical protein